MKLEEKIVKILKEKRKTLAVVESITGGAISQKITSVPGASKVFWGGLVLYSRPAKRKILNISAKLLKKGMVTETVSVLLAKRGLRLSKANFSLSTTGLAGPTQNGEKEKIGTVFISIVSQKKNITKKFIFKGNRFQIQSQACQKALKEILNFIS